MAYLCVFSLGSRKHLKDFLAFCLINERSTTKSCSYNLVTLLRWSTLLIYPGEGNSVMCCMTLAPESMTGETDKVCPASSIRCEGKCFSIAGGTMLEVIVLSKNNDFQHGSPILCSLLNIPWRSCLWHSQKVSMIISAAWDSLWHESMNYCIIHRLIHATLYTFPIHCTWHECNKFYT